MLKQPNNKRGRCKEKWLSMLSSEWFTVVLGYLNTIEQIVILDSAILNHTDRKHWLTHLKNQKIL